MARKLFPLPVQPILDNPTYKALPAAGVGILFRLVAHWWETDLRPLPIADHDLRAISRAHLNTWKEHKADILQAIAAIQPELAAYHAWRSQGRERLRIASYNGGAANAARASAKRIAASIPAPAPLNDAHQLGYVPQRQPSPERPPAPDKRPPRPIRVDKLQGR